MASYHAFVNGAFSRAPAANPLCADADGLARVSESILAAAFQAGPENPLVGLAGRAELLRRLGAVVERGPAFTPPDAGAPRRVGNLGDVLVAQAGPSATLPARAILALVLDALGPIWPGRHSLHGVNLGDVWPHPRLGLVPFHKLSQWLTYSLCEPLEEAGVRVVGLDELTGLAEYRNGGLFLDGGVLVPRHPAVTSARHAVGSEVVVEWRALTVALCDRVADELRRRLKLSSVQLPLAKVLEGGTWAAGRALARERRPDASPPLTIDSDGTVF